MTQQMQILAYLKRGRSLTPLDALRLFGSSRLAARIGELRDRGHQISRDWVERNGKRYARYRMG